MTNAMAHTGPEDYSSREACNKSELEVSNNMSLPKTPWSYPTSTNEAFRRASGRRAYNATRRVKAMVRACEVMRLWGEYGFDYGSRARIARELGVHRSTVTRDIMRVLRFEQEGILGPNPR
jgi:hypothetical protein